MREREPSVELRIVSDPGGAERRIPLARPARAALLLGGFALLCALLVAAAVLPGALATLRVHREYNLQLARRAQLGERVRVLVEGLSAVHREGEALARRVRRLQSIYGLPPLPAGEPGPAEKEARVPLPESIFAGTIAHGRRLADGTGRQLAAVDAAVAALASWEREHPDEASDVPVRWPLDAAVSVPTSGFGVRRSPAGGVLEFHAGLDFAAPAGTSIVAPAAGRVVFTGEAPERAGPAWWRLGRLVVVRFGDRFLGVFGHCDRVLVPRGRRVKPGDPLATVGTSGWTASPQLYYEIRRRGADGDWTALDPRLFLLASDLPESSPGEPSGSDLAPAELPRAFAR
jgi:hypothetical protein